MDPAQLLRFVTPDETAAEFFARQAAEALATGVFCVDAHARLRPGHVLEVAGPTGAGKTALLTEMAARFVAAAPHGGGGAVGGAGGAAAAPAAAAAAAPTACAAAAASAASAAPKPDCVVYVDLDCKFDPLRLLQLLRLLLNNDGEGGGAEQRQEEGDGNKCIRRLARCLAPTSQQHCLPPLL